MPFQMPCGSSRALFRMQCTSPAHLLRRAAPQSSFAHKDAIFSSKSDLLPKAACEILLFTFKQWIEAATYGLAANCNEPFCTPHCSLTWRSKLLFIISGRKGLRKRIPSTQDPPLQETCLSIEKHPAKCEVFGSPCWTRTNDPAVNSRMLYQLS